ncbi:NADP-dependent malic enzyme [Culex quinquefasciatus]|uniref:Malic enzyme n=1 Tax=Culex quinquefasciatus TaxID=7176 RepID=B0WQD0_CULQU|nr:NADP-dependent malic enzyme [Culex quinquefasciatus]|eukprot:XP_001850914.1 NADP-dependent malic enzyme [Culex quinquefasciatus]
MALKTLSLCRLLATAKLVITPSRAFREVTGDIIVPGQVKGISYLQDSRLNKGLAFSLEERQTLGVHGLLPATIRTLDTQVQLCRTVFSRFEDDLNRYVYLMDLHDRNETLFFKLVADHIELMLPIVYTPTVGLACQKFGLIYRKPRGLFVTVNDRGHVYQVLKNWPESDVRAIVVTDGERILGLGDLGACGMGIPVGKLALYTALAGIKPHQCLPVTIDVGTNNEEFQNDPQYIGLRQPRVQGDEYDELVDEFMRAVVKRYGQNTLIQFEDFGNQNAFRLLDAYRDKYCTFNDDIQGTAAVVLAGLYASERLTGKKIADHTFVFLGAGEAALGIADLVIQAMVEEGLSKEQAHEKVWMFDKLGLLASDRPEGDLGGPKKSFIRDHQPTKDFANFIKEVKPSVLIGASAAAGAFTQEVLQTMATNNANPIILALSNPTAKAECTAQEAYEQTEGRCIFASGSPFPPVEFAGKILEPGQGNNAYIFPGVALGVIASGAHHIPPEMFVIAAKVVGEMTTDEDLDRGSLYPPLRRIPECSLEIAIRVIECAYQRGIASFYPEPEDKREFVRSTQYFARYESALPVTWPWAERKRGAASVMKLNSPACGGKARG